MFWKLTAGQQISIFNLRKNSAHKKFIKYFSSIYLVRCGLIVQLFMPSISKEFIMKHIFKNSFSSAWKLEILMCMLHPWTLLFNDARSRQSISFNRIWSCWSETNFIISQGFIAITLEFIQINIQKTSSSFWIIFSSLQNKSHNSITT